MYAAPIAAASPEPKGDAVGGGSTKSTDNVKPDTMVVDLRILFIANLAIVTFLKPS